MPGTSRHRFPFLAAGQAQKELTHNEALALIDIAVSPAVVSAGIDEPPANPDEGQCWLVGDAPTGEWASHAGAIGCWTANSWRFLDPVAGMRVRILDQGLDALRAEGTWEIGVVAAASVEVADLQVVGPRQSAVADPAGGGVVDVEARAAVAALLARLRAHGLIES